MLGHAGPWQEQQARSERSGGAAAGGQGGDGAESRSSGNKSLVKTLLYITQCRNRYRPQDNNIAWWKSYVTEFFAPNSIVRVSVKDMPVFQQPYTSIPSSLTCTEVPFEVLPRLFQFKYENGVQEELLFLGNVIESDLADGAASIICYQAAEHLVFDGYSVIQYGHLKVVFNKAGKIQLLDFSVTGYDLHLDHSVVHTELRNLSQVLEERCQGLAGMASTSGQVDQRILQETLRSIIGYVNMFSGKLDQYLSFEWSYIQKVLHFMQMADVIGSIHDLFLECRQNNLSPLTALQKFGKTSARVVPWAAKEGHGATDGLDGEQQQHRQQQQQLATASLGLGLGQPSGPYAANGFGPGASPQLQPSNSPAPGGLRPGTASSGLGQQQQQQPQQPGSGADRMSPALAVAAAAAAAKMHAESSQHQSSPMINAMNSQTLQEMQGYNAQAAALGMLQGNGQQISNNPAMLALMSQAAASKAAAAAAGLQTSSFIGPGANAQLQHRLNAMQLQAMGQGMMGQGLGQGLPTGMSAGPPGVGLGQGQAMGQRFSLGPQGLQGLMHPDGSSGM